MGGLILCGQTKAERPYFVKNLGKNISTIEELCFFLYYHIYLLDEKIMEDDFINWVKIELSLPLLAEELKLIIAKQDGIENFAVHILRSVQYRTEEELEKYSIELKHLKECSELERAKQKADYLIKSKNYNKAIWEYRKLLKQENSDSMFQSNLYHNLGVAYGSMFDFEQSSQCFLKAFELCPNQESLRHYKLSIRLSERNLEEDELSKGFPLTHIIDQHMEKEIEGIIQGRIPRQDILEELKKLKAENKLQEYYVQIDKILHQWQDECRRYMNC